jgi:methionine synthase I (cobalamin-dependent)
MKSGGIDLTKRRSDSTMFSREWFFYVFGRWIVISGIAGAIVQYLFSDMAGIPTIPAFLLNQFCLACVFWYVDKLIFKRHFEKGISEFFRFPRIKTAYGMREQFDKVNQEFSGLQARIAGNEEKPELWLNEFVDFEHSVEMLERLLRERNIDVDKEYEKVKTENLERGYYRIAEAGKASPKRRESAFLDTLSEEVLLADGAMGTYLQTKVPGGVGCPESLNLSDPETVVKAHAEYVAAGARIIETNTFAANRYQLAQYGLSDRVWDINLAGARIAREATVSATSNVFVAGAVGPLGEQISPYGKLSLVQAHAAFHEQIQALIEGGVDLIMLETMSSFLEAKEAVLVCTETTDLPIVCQLTFTEQGVTVAGDKLAEAFDQLEKLGADVVGLNCSVGPRKMIELLGSLPKSFTGMISVQPNAGTPRYMDGSREKSQSPAYFKKSALQLKNLGVNIIGGCCGTTPAHIRKMAEVVGGRPVGRGR